MKVEVIRNSEILMIEIDDLQPGDVVPIDKEEQKMRKEGLTLRQILHRRILEA